MRRRKGKIVAGVAGVVVAVLIGVYWRDISAWVKFVYLFESIGRNQQGYAEYRHLRTGIAFVSLPGGVFSMGTSEDDAEGFGENWRKYLETEQPKHTVTLSPFLIAKYEVTQAEWQQVQSENPSWFNPNSGGGRDLAVEFLQNEKWLGLPVETVTWQECQDFCSQTGLSLPTEAQWEYACRAGKPGSFSGTGKREDMGWQVDTTQPVGLKKPNDFGIHDMHGNVGEWCQDVFDEDFYDTSPASGHDPVRSSGSEERVHRGGGLNMADEYHRSAFRNHSPTSGNRVRQSLPGHIGFRPVFNLR